MLKKNFFFFFFSRPSNRKKNFFKKKISQVFISKNCNLFNKNPKCPKEKIWISTKKRNFPRI